MKRRSVSREKRSVVAFWGYYEYKARGGEGKYAICSYCGKRGRFIAGKKAWWVIEEGIAPFEVDHIIPVSRGGTNDYENLTLACRWCNRSKGAKNG